MLNNFQKDMLKPENRHIAWEIVKLFHPETPDTFVSRKGVEYKCIDKMQVYSKYDWICISFMMKDIKCDIGMELPTKFYGTGWKMKDFEKQMKNRFRAWRFSMDSKYVPETPEEVHPDINLILNKHGIRKPSPTQMMDFYYKD
jgi:hypothetical protein